MKILAISHLSIVSYETPSGYGGRAFHKPTSALVSMGCDVQVVAPVPFVPFSVRYLANKWKLYSKISRYETVDNVGVYHPRFVSFPKSFLLSCSGYLMYYGIKRLVKSIYKQFPFDLIHAHNAFPDGYAGLMLSRNYHKPLVITIRGTDMDITAKRSNLCLRQIKEVVKAAKGVISPSPRLHRILHTRFGVISKTNCNGIDVDEMSHINDITLAENFNKHIVLLSVSELIHSKGIDLNLKAIQTLKQKYSNLLYVIVGDGPARKELEQLVQNLHLGKFVKFMGTLPHSESMKLMSICDIYSMPSWRETFGLVYLEAMAFGKPVIGCKGQGMDNIISEEKVGLLAEPKDWHSVANALDLFLSNPEEARMTGERGRKLVLENFTHNKNAERTLELYNTILENV